MILTDIINFIKPDEFIGNNNQVINDIVKLDETNTREDIISWCSDKNLNQLRKAKSGTYICSKHIYDSKFSQSCNYLIVKNPRDAFRKLLIFYLECEAKENYDDLISKAAFIHVSAKIGSDVRIANNVVIERNCIVGNNSSIGHNTVILAGTIIRNNVTIGCNNTIGGVGFGYELSEQKKYELIPHIGNVVVEDNVEIGNNTCIDKAVIGSTIIRKNAKIDNLVHIAHGVEIGENSLIIANAMVAGSTLVGKNCWVAPSSSILNNIKLGDKCIIGMGAVVLKNVESNQVVVGNPGKPLIK